MKRRRRHHIGSHSRHSRPEEQMSPPRRIAPGGAPALRNPSPSSTQNRVIKALTNRKRRQRDRAIAQEDT